MNFKKLIPYDEYTLKTKLSFKEVKRRISSNVVPTRSIKEHFFEETDKMFEGYVSESNFKLNRLINGRNSFLPLIEGHLFIQDEITIIKIYSRTLYWKLILFFFAGVFFFFALNGFNRFFNTKENIYFPLLLPVVTYLFSLISFNVMNKKTKQFLIKLLDTECD